MGVVYLSKNKKNGKCYVGRTIKTLEERKYQHIWLSKNKKEKSYFHRALRKYGEENFEWIVLYESEDVDVLNDLEIACITKYDSFKNGYNLTKGGDGRLKNGIEKLKIKEKPKRRFNVRTINKSVSLPFELSEEVNKALKIFKIKSFSEMGQRGLRMYLDDLYERRKE